MSPAGAGALEVVNADDRSAVAVAVNPTADNFRKVRLLCMFDTEFSWHESLRCEYSA
jgi:pectin methylesterase-like acyl-CoA thioesterase